MSYYITIIIVTTGVSSVGCMVYEYLRYIKMGLAVIR